MNEIAIGNTNSLTVPAGSKLQISVSQQPYLYFDQALPVERDQGFIVNYINATQTWMNGVLRFQEANRHDRLQWAEALIQVSETIGSLLQKTDELAAQIERIASQRTFVVPLTTLEPEEPLHMKMNIPATVEGDGDDFIATFTEANVSASGETEADAIANLKESIVATYKILESIPASEMSPLPARQWNVLKSVIAR